MFYKNRISELENDVRYLKERVIYLQKRQDRNDMSFVGTGIVPVSTRQVIILILEHLGVEIASQEGVVLKKKGTK